MEVLVSQTSRACAVLLICSRVYEWWRGESKEETKELLYLALCYFGISQTKHDYDNNNNTATATTIEGNRGVWGIIFSCLNERWVWVAGTGWRWTMWRRFLFLRRIAAGALTRWGIRKEEIYTTRCMCCDSVSGCCWQNMNGSLRFVSSNCQIILNSFFVWLKPVVESEEPQL